MQRSRKCKALVIEHTVVGLKVIFRIPGQSREIVWVSVLFMCQLWCARPSGIDVVDVNSPRSLFVISYKVNASRMKASNEYFCKLKDVIVYMQAVLLS